jgi:hypothetical protein
MFYAEISKQFGTMPFNLRLLPEEGKARMGVVECLSHKLIDPFQVLYEKSSEFPSKSLYSQYFSYDDKLSTPF